MLAKMKPVRTERKRVNLQNIPVRKLSNQGTVLRNFNIISNYTKSVTVKSVMRVVQT